MFSKEKLHHRAAIKSDFIEGLAGAARTPSAPANQLRRRPAQNWKDSREVCSDVGPEGRRNPGRCRKATGSQSREQSAARRMFSKENLHHRAAIKNNVIAGIARAARTRFDPTNQLGRGTVSRLRHLSLPLSNRGLLLYYRLLKTSIHPLPYSLVVIGEA